MVDVGSWVSAPSDTSSKVSMPNVSWVSLSSSPSRTLRAAPSDSHRVQTGGNRPHLHDRLIQEAHDSAHDLHVFGVCGFFEILEQAGRRRSAIVPSRRARSWLISRCTFSRPSSRRRSMSRAKERSRTTTVRGSPARAPRGPMLSSTGKIDPSRCRPIMSRSSPLVAEGWPRIREGVCADSLGSINSVSICSPSTSSARKPNMRSAARLNASIEPSGRKPMIVSVAASRIDRKRSWLFLQGLLSRANVADVDAGSDEAEETAGSIVARHTVIEQPAVLAVRAPQPVLELERFAARECFDVSAEAALQVLAMDALGPPDSAFLLQLAAGEGEPGVVEKRAVCVRPRHPQQNRRTIRHRCKPLLAFEHERLLAIAVGDVAHPGAAERASPRRARAGS